MNWLNWRKKTKETSESNVCGCFMSKSIDDAIDEINGFENNNDMYTYCLDNNILDRKLVYKLFKDNNINYKEFCLDKNVTYLNNGAFGACFKSVLGTFHIR